MAVSKWTHSMCGDCWNKENPGRTPSVVVGAIDLCCFCGAETTLGIYVRRDPNEVLCKGTYMMHLPEEELDPNPEPEPKYWGEGEWSDGR